MIRLLVEGINPEPWTSPSLGIKKVGRKAVPSSFKNENQRAFQLALHELVEETLVEQAIPFPIFGAGIELRTEWAFWRQLDSYNVGDQGRARTRQRPDLTNLVKAAEDALQGLLYLNDRAIRQSKSLIVDVGPDVEPAVMVMVEALYESRHYEPCCNYEDLRRTCRFANGVPSSSGMVWTESEP